MKKRALFYKNLAAQLGRISISTQPFKTSNWANIYKGLFGSIPMIVKRPRADKPHNPQHGESKIINFLLSDQRQWPDSLMRPFSTPLDYAQSIFLEDLNAPLKEEGSRFFNVAPLDGLQTFLKDMLTAIDYLNGREIAHFDIKLENIYLANRSGRVCYVLADFGLIQSMYKKPEMICQKYTVYPIKIPNLLEKDIHHLDLWYLGIAAIMLATQDILIPNNTTTIQEEDGESSALCIHSIISNATRFNHELLSIPSIESSIQEEDAVPGFDIEHLSIPQIIAFFSHVETSISEALWIHSIQESEDTESQEIEDWLDGKTPPPPSHETDISYFWFCTLLGSMMSTANPISAAELLSENPLFLSNSMPNTHLIYENKIQVKSADRQQKNCGYRAVMA